jgi:hypothetical protein
MAEKEKRMLVKLLALIRDSIAREGVTYQSAMLNPQIDFISRQVLLAVPIHKL